MNPSQLAEAMLEWEKRKRELDILTWDIQEAILKLGKTQTVGNVRASYSTGRKVYDYEGAAKDALPPKQLETFSECRINYKAAYESLPAMMQPDLPSTQGTPSVTVKLLEVT